MAPTAAMYFGLTQTIGSAATDSGDSLARVLRVDVQWEARNYLIHWPPL